jgi:CDP-ribitol ribitolphosphotransferase
MRLVLPHRGKKRILLAPQLRTDLRDNMLALHRRLVERGLDTEFSVKVFPDVPRTSTIATARHWLTAVKQFAWADFIFLDDWCDLLMYITPSPRTVITQLWHGGFGFKTVGFSQFGLPGGPDLNPPHRKYTYSVVGAEGARDQFAESFGIEREAVLPTGVPRVDDLLDPVRRTEVTERFHDEFPEFTGRRIILFAPTFRGQGSDSAYYPSDLIDWEALHQWCGDDTAVIVAMHPYVTARMVDDQERRVHLVPNNLRDRIREDVTGWPVNDLLLMADTLVTDYSSICYEYTYLQRPIVFYAPDEAEYSATRGFYARLEDVAPGPVVTTFPDLLSALDSNEAANERTLRYRQRFCGPADTHNADRLIDRVLFH